MDNISSIKNLQIAELQEICNSNNVDYNSMEKLLQSEKIKKLQRRNHYIQHTINSEIEKALENENK
jgi:hypothetical protein